jgi:ABC-type amino acid transport substrate-binding protein
MWQAYVRFKSGSTTRADVADSEEDARKALDDAMKQLKADGIGMVGPSLVVTKEDLEFIKLEQKQQER